jgi:hypothetical protein
MAAQFLRSQVKPGRRAALSVDDCSGAKVFPALVRFRRLSVFSEMDRECRMNPGRKRCSFMVRLAVGIAVFACGQMALAQCHVPRFNKGRDYGATVQVSVAPSEFTVANLACLSEKLHARRGVSQILFFTSRIAAANFYPAQIENPPDWIYWAAALHAGYFFERDQREEFLEIYPLGFKGDRSLDSRIDLPLSGASSCREKLGGRCVIALAELMIPSEVVERGGEGSVVLGGTVARNGRIIGIRIVDNSVSEEKCKALLANLATQNLATWQVEPRSNEDAFKFTYTFVADSQASKASTEVKWELPDRVVVISHRGPSQ